MSTGADLKVGQRQRTKGLLEVGSAQAGLVERQASDPSTIPRQPWNKQRLGLPLLLLLLQLLQLLL